MQTQIQISERLFPLYSKSLFVMFLIFSWILIFKWTNFLFTLGVLEFSAKCCCFSISVLQNSTIKYKCVMENQKYKCRQSSKGKVFPFVDAPRNVNCQVQMCRHRQVGLCSFKLCQQFQLFSFKYVLSSVCLFNSFDSKMMMRIGSLSEHLEW